MAHVDSFGFDAETSDSGSTASLRLSAEGFDVECCVWLTLAAAGRRRARFWRDG